METQPCRDKYPMTVWTNEGLCRLVTDADALNQLTQELGPNERIVAAYYDAKAAVAIRANSAKTALTRLENEVSCLLGDLTKIRPKYVPTELDAVISIKKAALRLANAIVRILEDYNEATLPVKREMLDIVVATFRGGNHD